MIKVPCLLLPPPPLVGNLPSIIVYAASEFGLVTMVTIQLVVFETNVYYIGWEQVLPGGLKWLNSSYTAA